MVGVLATCAVLFLGDSISVQLSRYVPYSGNLAIVGNTPIDTLNTLDKDLKPCTSKPVVLSLGSNVIKNNQTVEFTRIKKAIDQIKADGRKVYILPVPMSKHLKKKRAFNRFLRSIDGVTVLKDLPKNCNTSDGIHVKKKCLVIWKDEYEKSITSTN